MLGESVDSGLAGRCCQQEAMPDRGSGMRLGQGWAPGAGRASPPTCSPGRSSSRGLLPQHRGDRVQPSTHTRCTQRAGGRRARMHQRRAAGGIRARHAAGTRASAPPTPHNLPSASVCHVNTQLPAGGCLVLPALPLCQAREVGKSTRPPRASWIREPPSIQNTSFQGSNAGFPAGSVVKNPPASAGDKGSMPDPGRSHALPATKPVSPNNCACALEPGSRSYGSPRA